MEKNIDALLLIRVDHKRARNIYDAALRRFNLMMPELLEAVREVDEQIEERNRQRRAELKRRREEWDAKVDRGEFPPLYKMPSLSLFSVPLCRTVLEQKRSHIKRVLALADHATADFNMRQEDVLDMADMESGEYFNRLREWAGLPLGPTD